MNDVKLVSYWQTDPPTLSDFNCIQEVKVNWGNMRWWNYIYICWINVETCLWFFFLSLDPQRTQTNKKKIQNLAAINSLICYLSSLDSDNPVVLWCIRSVRSATVSNKGACHPVKDACAGCSPVSLLMDPYKYPDLPHSEWDAPLKCTPWWGKPHWLYCGYARYCGALGEQN